MKIKTVTMPDLFVIDHGRLRVRKSKVEGDENGPVLWKVETGLVDGAMVPHDTIYLKGKGKRTPFEQACAEQLSKHKLKMKKDKYREGENNAIDPADDPYPPPMLAKKYDPKKHKPPFLLQPKLDGNRCLARVNRTTLISDVEMWSRQGNLFQGLEHIEEALKKLARVIGLEEVVFDGELFTWEMPFKDINGILKSKPKDLTTLKGKPLEKALGQERRRAAVQFWIYDMPTINGNETKRQKLRESYMTMGDIPDAAIELNAKEAPLISVPTLEAPDIETMQRIHSMFLESGYEGTIIRMPEGLYRYDARSSDLLKYKEFQDSEYMVVDVIEAEKLPGCGIFVCQTKSGTRFKATPKCSVEEKIFILSHKDDYIGKEMTVEYFETFEDGTPRFPVAKVSF